MPQDTIILFYYSMFVAFIIIRKLFNAQTLKQSSIILISQNLHLLYKQLLNNTSIIEILHRLIITAIDNIQYVEKDEK